MLFRRNSLLTAHSFWGLQCFERWHFKLQALLLCLLPAVHHCVVKDCLPHALKLLPN